MLKNEPVPETGIMPISRAAIGLMSPITRAFLPRVV